MAEDFSNRIGPRKAAVQTHERPTREAIEALLQRHKEHAKRTRPPPKKNFDSYLAEAPAAPGGAEAPAPEANDAEAAAAAQAQGAPVAQAPGRPKLTSGPGGHKRVIKA